MLPCEPRTLVSVCGAGRPPIGGLTVQLQIHLVSVSKCPWEDTQPQIAPDAAPCECM